MSRIAPLASLSLSLLATACLTSDGAPGNEGKVRFSQVLRYQATDGFDAPIVRGSTLMLALQATKGWLDIIDQETLADHELSVEGDSSAVLPLGFAQYALQFKEEGSYTLNANYDGKVVDWLRVQVEDAASMEVHPTAQLATRFRDGGRECFSSEEVKLSEVTLHQNQELTIYLVPKTESGRSMIGLLNLDVNTESPVGFDSPLVGQGRSANALRIIPQDTLGATVEVSLSELNYGFDTQLSVKADSEPQRLSCRN